MKVVAYPRLSAQQQRAVGLPTNRHQVVVGGPGSGKSLVLLHRATRLVENGIPADRIQIVTYTNALEQYLRSGATQIGLPKDCVTTYDSLISNYFTRLIGGKFPKTAEGDRDYDETRRMVGERVTARPRRDFDAVLVDEGQDLGAADFATLRGLSEHVTVVMDSRQRLYDRGSTAAEICSALGIPYAEVNLLDGFRCSRSVIEVAAAVADDPKDRERLLNSVSAPGANSSSVLLLTDDREKLDEVFIDTLRSRMSAGDSCCVLVGTNRWAFGVANSLRAAGIDVQGPRPSSLDLSSPAVPVMTLHSAKGLTFDSVFLPRLVESAFGSQPAGERRTALLFVAATRATKFLFLGAAGSRPLPELRRLEGISARYLSPPAMVAAPVDDDDDWDPSF